ncbi:MAG: NYN domain protein [Syntrophorhabdus sp. PtaU1.Bin153]|nr:MAG: NYN domain protein [Syntrophorhabdus sp. PtaU1.Bin153]
MNNVAILWDMENVNPGSNSLFLEGLIEYAEAKGRVVAARAYGNWNHSSLSKLAPSLTRRYFYLVHIPKGQKNSSDMVLVSDTLEILRIHDHIDTFILVTGDSDFRFLVLALRRAGKTVYIVCNTRNASEDLLALADSYVDYRELVPGGNDDESGVTPQPTPEDKAAPEKAPTPVMTEEDWFQILAEAADLMLSKKIQPGIGSLKIRMKMLNANFNEKKLGFSHWSEFVAAAVKAGFVTIEGKGPEALVYPVPGMLKEEGIQRKAFSVLIEVLSELDRGNKPVYHSYRSVNSKLIEKKVYFNDLGFNQFKEFIQAAEARGLVESQVEGLKHSVKRL